MGQDHVGTNLSPSAHLYLEGDGESRFSHMSQCVGVGAWLLTADNMIVLVENAAWKGEQSCRYAGIQNRLKCEVKIFLWGTLKY